MAACRSCGATVAWAITDRNKLMLINPPSDDGDLFAWWSPGVKPRVSAHPPDTPAVLEPDGAELHKVKSHFATCPNADSHRKARK